LRIILGPDQPIVDSIRDAAARHERGRARIAVAWAREEGVRWLLDAIAGRLPQLEVIVGLNERGTTAEALLRLLPMTTFLGAFYKHPRQTFHPKLYLFDDGRPEPAAATVIVGSSNLTRGGLVTNVEASLIAERARGDDAATPLLVSALAAWENLRNSPFTIPITEQRIRELYEGGYLATEALIRRQRRETARHQAPRRDIRTAPPPPVRPPAAEPVVFPFPVEAVQEQQVPLEDADPEWTVPVPDCTRAMGVGARGWRLGRAVTRSRARRVGRVDEAFGPSVIDVRRTRLPAVQSGPRRSRRPRQVIPSYAALRTK
jgi:HKD family nuclease